MIQITISPSTLANFGTILRNARPHISDVSNYSLTPYTVPKVKTRGQPADTHSIDIVPVTMYAWGVHQLDTNLTGFQELPASFANIQAYIDFINALPSGKYFMSWSKSEFEEPHNATNASAKSDWYHLGLGSLLTTILGAQKTNAIYSGTEQMTSELFDFIVAISDKILIRNTQEEIISDFVEGKSMVWISAGSWGSAHLIGNAYGGFTKSFLKSEHPNSLIDNIDQVNFKALPHLVDKGNGVSLVTVENGFGLFNFATLSRKPHVDSFVKFITKAKNLDDLTLSDDLPSNQTKSAEFLANGSYDSKHKGFKDQVAVLASTSETVAFWDNAVPSKNEVTGSIAAMKKFMINLDAATTANQKSSAITTVVSELNAVLYKGA